MIYPRKKFRFFPLIFCFFLIVFASGLFYLVFYSRLFEVKEIEILGASSPFQESLIKDKVIHTILSNSSILSIFGPAHLFFWSNKVIKRDFFLPQISEIELSKDWFKKKVFIKIKERIPFAILAQENSNLAARTSFWLDKDGIIFGFAPLTDGFLVLKIRDENKREIKLGKPIFEKEKMTANFLYYLSHLKKIPLAVEEVVIRELFLREIKVKTLGPDIYFSLDFPFENFWQIISDIQEKDNLSRIDYFDFRVENRIYYK